MMKSAWYAQLWRGKNAIVWLQRRLIRPGRRTKKLPVNWRSTSQISSSFCQMGSCWPRFATRIQGPQLPRWLKVLVIAAPFIVSEPRLGHQHGPTLHVKTIQTASMATCSVAAADCLCVCVEAVWYDVDMMLIWLLGWVWPQQTHNSSHVYMSCLYPFLAAHAVESSPFASEQSVGFPLVIPSI